jgi:CheY-like chemotaxis protein
MAIYRRGGMTSTASLPELNSEHMIDEVRASIRARDAIKVRLVLDHLGAVDQRVQHRLIYELLRADAEFTAPLLNRLVANYPEVCEKLPIIRETLVSHLIAHPELIEHCLADPTVTDKRIMVEVVEELQLKNAVPLLFKALGQTTDRETIRDILDVLGDLGGPEAVSELTEYLYSAERDLTISAISALGRIRTVEAMNALAERMGTDNELDLQILAVFAEVQDAISLKFLNAALRSPHTRTRGFAKEKLASVGEKAVTVLAGNLSESDPDFLIHTLNVLGDIGHASAVAPIRRLLSGEPNDANVRFAAYETLACLPLSRGAFALAAGLSDKEDHVCIAAARAIDRNLNDVLVAGIKNLLHESTDDARHIVKIIINAQVESLFLSLVDEDVFQGLALVYLPHSHREVREFHARVLRNRGRHELAIRVESGELQSQKPKLRKICVVDDSRIVLSIYRSTLHELGFEPVLFEFPASALEWLKEEKPALVFTDLNMPKISGLELARQIREFCPASELPIIMVTTQSDVRDDSLVTANGINEVLAKPFDATTLLAAMGRHLNLN